MDGVQENLRPTRSEKTLGALKAERAVKRITFKSTEANPLDTLYVSVPKLNENEVIVPGSLALRFNIDLSGGHANNFLVDNVGRALVDKLVVNYSGTILQDTVGYDIYKIFEDLFLSQEERDNMLQDGIQSVGLNKIRSNAGDKQTSGVDTENKLNGIYGTKYRIRLDHQILNDHGTFYPQALFNDLGFSARHIGISVWVLTQKITSITPSFRENVAAIVLFYTPSAKTTKAIFDDYAGELSHDEYKNLISKLKERKFSYLVFLLRYPYGIHFELKK